MEKTANARQIWLKWTLIAAGWSLFAVFFASESVVGRAYFSRPLHLGETLLSWLICACVWLGATPFVLALSRRFPLERRSWLTNLFIHLGASCVFAFLLLAIYVAVASWVGLEIGKLPFSQAFRNQFIASFHAEILTYWAVIGLTHAVDYYRKYREREVRASQLEAQLARAQLDALKMQLQPHFLFNTLNTISVLMTEDVALANRVLLRLSDLLRLALKNTELHEVSLREELEFLRNYLEIEQTRFHDRLTVRIDIEDDAAEAQVPNLILQPLVENAIRHAVAPRATRSLLEIRATRRNGDVELLVRDDGPGIHSEVVSTNGIGLRNTRARLEKLYGPAHSFHLTPAEGGGLQVTIIIPFHTADGHGVSLNGKDPRAHR
ncbi:MAG: histidine kinase [Acidobacteriota bacterium]